MSIRIHLSRFLLRFGAFIQTLPIVIMTPDDLVEFSRQSYTKPGNVEGWSDEMLINTGLNPNELELINSVPKKNGRLLLLGIGGGREAIPFARMGFHVTGVDFVPAMIERAKQNAEKYGVHIEGLVQEISNLDVTNSSFDVVWISSAMYSCVPTSSKRIYLLRKISQILKPDGILVCLFHHDSNWLNKKKGERFLQIIAASPFGNKDYENGDVLWLNREFLHIFTSEAEIRSELEASGMFVCQLNLDHASVRGSAVCVKASQVNSQNFR